MLAIKTTKLSFSRTGISSHLLLRWASVLEPISKSMKSTQISAFSPSLSKSSINWWLCLISFRSVSANTYVNIDFVKSGTFTVSSRSFNKIDAYFSYVGGLVGTIISLIFILNTFSERSFEISIASHLFVSPDAESIPAKKYNFFYYLATVLKDFLSFFKIKT